MVINAHLETVLKEFPNATEGNGLTEAAVNYLKKTYGFTPQNTLFGFCTCPDEINRTVTRFMSYYGDKQFPLGGLAGYPFTGKTGFSAFSHHAPDNGNLVILYGHHVGIAQNGELGKVLRENQSHESSACGAAIAFLKKYNQSKSKGELCNPQDDALDMQQCHIEKKLLPFAEQILGAENQIKKLVEVNYRLIEKELLEIIKELAHHFKGKIALMGGIMINTKHSQPSYFDLKRAEIYINGQAERLKL